MEFISKLADGEFVVTSELSPPKGTDLTILFEKAENLRNHVDAFNLTDSHASRMSLAPIAASKHLLDRNIVPILQITTRDRNRIALQADMLAAASLGITNIVCMGGDPPHLGDHPEAKPVFDISTQQLLTAAFGLNNGVDLSGNKLNACTNFNIGAVVNPGADNLDQEISRLEEKVAAGATFVQTQAVYDTAAFLVFLDKISHIKVSILAGILPIKSKQMAEHLNKNIPGIEISDRILNRLESAVDFSQESIELAAETVAAVSQASQGVHIMALGWESAIPDILEKSGVNN